MPTSSLSLRLPWAQLQLKPKRLLLPQAWQLPLSQASAGTSTTWPYSRPHVQPHLHVGPFTCSSHKGGPISFPAQNSPPATLPTTTAEMLTRKQILPPSPGPLQQGLKPRVLSTSLWEASLVQSPPPLPSLNPPLGAHSSVQTAQARQTHRRIFLKNTSECRREFPWLQRTYFLKKI